MSSLALDFAANESQAGFRLHAVELYNWGTFHDRVWRIAPNGANSLLTGDIGSGKSTLVDAVTTLLVPAQRITYNKAAGAETRERSLRSYVLGYYKSERDDTSTSARPVALRDTNSYSVILGHFRNTGFDADVTLAQVFWITGQGQPERFYVIADRALTLAEHFADFGRDINDLKKRLRATDAIELFDSFPGYGAAFRRRFGIDNEQALELFAQTVSMKSVGNLTEFVRTHMLEAAPVDERVDALIAHFDDLNRAHESVVDARRQVEALTPLVADHQRLAEINARISAWRDARDALEPWFAGLKADLLTRRIDNLDGELTRAESQIETLTAQQRRQAATRDQLKDAIATHGGDRIEQLAGQIDEARRERAARQARAESYNTLAEALGFAAADSAERFADNQRQLPGAREAAEARRSERENEHVEAEIGFRRLKSEHGEIQVELASLRQRRSNLPAAVLALRDRLCADLDLASEDVPFAGELIQVREDERDWEGAAERVLHNFGLSLLVADADYPRIADWVDRTHLRGRLVYYRVRERRATASTPDPGPDSLIRKLAIKPDSPFYGWLEAELARRFDYACCADMARFRREPKALTRAGQIKTAGGRHEKDDRHAIGDRSRYILGWSNEAKIEALEKQAADLETRMVDDGARIADLQQQITVQNRQLGDLAKLEVYTRFDELDWASVTAQISRLQEEKDALESASDTLRTLRDQLAKIDERRRETDNALETARDERARRRERRDTAEIARADAAARHDQASETQYRETFPRLESLRAEALGDAQLTVESCDNRQTDMRRWLQAAMDRDSKQAERTSARVVGAMADFKHSWPLASQDFDAHVEAGHEYAALLEQLTGDDLPRFEARFKDLLNENTIREVAGFQAYLNQARERIRERIETINKSLHDIDFNPGRYIALLADPSPDPEIGDFFRDLRATTEGTLAGDASETYSETKFEQVRAIIARLRGREGTTELDRRWRRKVTDVRNGFVFSAAERWREDDTEHEHYSDSAGKSGGQKEKLAYTVLAASLAYQFGLEWGVRRSRTFRFAVIDEAFGRGSDESARFGLSLFQQLNLQLLIVTPLQKIHIIEPFVESVGFVHAPDGAHSMVRNLSIEEYRAEKAARGPNESPPDDG